MMNILSNWRSLWQKKGPKQLGSLGINPEDYTFQKETTQPTTSLLRSCKTVMLATFIDCYCHEIYTGLGEGTQEEIAEAWTEIVSEWSGLMRNKDSEYLLDLSGRILAIKTHLTYVEYSIFCLRRRYVPEFIEKLIEIGYPGMYPEHDKDALDNQLDLVLNLSKTHVFSLVELQEEYDRLHKTHKGGKMDEMEFQEDISKVAKYQGHPINKFTTSVFDYIAMRNGYVKDIENSNKQNKPPDI